MAEKEKLNELLKKVIDGVRLSDAEIIWLEYLRKAVLETPEPQVMEMSATLKGIGGL